MTQKVAVVTGASGLIGSHTVRRLKAEGYFVRAVSRSPNDDVTADEYMTADLTMISPSADIFHKVDEVYQFACQVGGLGYIADRANDAEVLRDSTLIDIRVLDACVFNGVKKVFFASSGCVYNSGKRFYAESDATPANPSNEFAWQKVFAERLYQAYARNHPLQVRIGRIFNTYGMGMAWEGGREKSVAALCRKIAQAKDGGTIDVWGSGEQTRSYTYIDDCVEGIWRLMQNSADVTMPINIGPAQETTIRDLIRAVCSVAGKKVFCRFGDGPTGVSKICSDNTVAKALLGWEPSIPVEEGLKTVYPWIKEQIDKAGVEA